MFEGAAQGRREFGQTRAPVHPETLPLLPDGRGGVEVVLVADLAHDLLEHVLQRNQAGGAAELVHHDGHVRRAPLEVPELSVQRLGFRHDRGRSHQLLPAPLALAGRKAHHERDQVLDVQDAHQVVWGAVVHREARVLPAAEHIEHLVA